MIPEWGVDPTGSAEPQTLGEQIKKQRLELHLLFRSACTRVDCVSAICSVLAAKATLVLNQLGCLNFPDRVGRIP